MTDNDLKKEYEPDDATEVRATLESILQKSRLTRGLCPPGTRPLEASAWDEEEDVYAERRAVLRQQAEWLKSRGL